MAFFQAEGGVGGRVAPDELAQAHRRPCRPRCGVVTVLSSQLCHGRQAVDQVQRQDLLDQPLAPGFGRDIFVGDGPPQGFRELARVERHRLGLRPGDSVMVYKLGETYYAAHTNEFSDAPLRGHSDSADRDQPAKDGYVAAVAQCRELADHRRLPRGYGK